MNPIEQVLPTTSEHATTKARNLYRKVIWRLMPYLLIAFVFNAIDRINLSFAKLNMAADIGLSDAAYGIGAGIFYLGYILFEIPSNLYMQRVGARATLTRIMVLWGLITVAIAFVTTPNQLIAVRFLLGAAEAGFFAGVILYLTYWFPSALRGRITAIFYMSALVAGIISGPLAGWIMTSFNGWMGLRDWQVLFVLEGIPAVLLGLFGWFWLTDKPSQATWLSDSEKQAIIRAVEVEPAKSSARGGFSEVLRDPRVYIAGLTFFFINCGSHTVSYWMPTLIRGFGVEDMKTIGMLSSLPFIGALCGMYLLARSSDKRQERRWHVGLTMLASAISFFLLGFAQASLPLTVLLLSLGAATTFSAISLFWTIPPALLTPAKAAGGIALISTMGNFAGVVSQMAVGAIKSATGNLYMAFDVIAAVLVIGALLLLIAIPAHCLEARRPGTGAD
ncbi:MFS transporter [Pseudomonas sp. RIT-PI-q]|uniref:MFS transporter n=1 Tax=Pseudomonas sp. RIT-PI-q TaxID=1690247 RepID=UPI0006CCF6D5|nr:MFS transporter [Pseudomonas sp. RIT-PI-q]KPH01506.1 MFS transporter [Pseudomonas sp. RIT-PI-q]